MAGEVTRHKAGTAIEDGRASIEALSQGYAVIGFDWRFLYVNPAGGKFWNFDCRKAVGRAVTEVFPELHDSEALRCFDAVMRERKSVRFEAYKANIGETGRWYEFHVDPVADGIAVMTFDITDRARIKCRLTRLEKAYDSAGWGIAILEQDGLIEEVNPAYARMHGYRAEELIGKPVDIVYPEPANGAAAKQTDDVESRSRGSYETSHQRRDGELFPVRVEATTVLKENGTVAFRIINVHDISELRRTYSAMRLTEELFRSFFEHSPIGIAISSLDGHYLRTNLALCDFLGYRQDELLQKTWRDITYPDDLPPRELFAAFLSGDPPTLRLEKRYVRKDGRLRWALTVVSTVRGPNGSDRRLLAQVVDIDQLKQTETEILRSREQLRTLAARQEKLLDDQRKHIAAEIHGRLGQQLTALRMEVGLLRMREGGSAAVLEFADRMRILIDDTIGVVRNLATNLHPVELELGICPAILSLVDTFRKQFGIECMVNCPSEEFSLPSDDAILLYRVVQEGLANVARHAHAGRVWLSAQEDELNINIVLEDDGIGFDVAGAMNGKSYGLFGMQERVRTLGGRIEFDSRVGRGTRLCISLPRKT